MPNGVSELRILALIEGVEAIGANLESAIVFEIESVVGISDLPPLPAAAQVSCTFSLPPSVVNIVLERLYTILCNVIQSLINAFSNVVDLIIGAIGRAVETLVDGVGRTISFLIETLTTRMSNLIEAVIDRVTRVIDSIVDALKGVVDAIANQVRTLVNKIQDVIASVLDGIKSAVATIVDQIGDSIKDLLDAISAGFDKVASKLDDIISALVDAVFNVVTSLGSSIANLIDVLVTSVESGLGALRSVIEDIPATLRELADETQKFFGDTIGTPLANAGNIFITQVEEFFGKLIDDLDVSPSRIMQDFLGGCGAPPEVVAKIGGCADEALPKTPAIFALLAGAIVPFMIGAMMPAVFGPVFENLRQEVAKIVPSTLLTPIDAIDAFSRGEMSEAEFRDELDQAGFSDRRKDILLATSRRLLDIGEVFRWWLRDFITEEKLDELLAFHRINDEDTALLKEAVFFIPPVQDLIRMAVREVFTPDVRERFELDQDFPEEFQEFAKKQAVSEEWSKNYWAAHWLLPSVTQGFTMLHRKVITLDDLDLLLRAQDVMPFWRDKITQVAFHPLTRVDVRRMHKLGLLTEDELQLRYEDLGFAADNAGLMVEFTKAFNSREPSDAELEIQGLTRSTVLSMFEDGIFTEDEAIGVLTALGLSPEAADLFVSQRILEAERSDRKFLIENIIRLAGGGHINLDRAQDSLAGIGLTVTEIALAVQRILASRGSRDRLPTMAQINKMLSSDIIDEEAWTEAMGGLGFSDVWIERLGQLTTTEA